MRKEFASSNYRNSAYVNFEDAEVVQSGETLLILDEIQAAERALTSLKYFQEKAPGLHVVAAGSLLGVSTQKDSFPVPKE